MEFYTLQINFCKDLIDLSSDLNLSSKDKRNISVTRVRPQGGRVSK